MPAPASVDFIWETGDQSTDWYGTAHEDWEAAYNQVGDAALSDM